MAIKQRLNSVILLVAKGVTAAHLAVIVGLTILTGVASLAWPLVQDSPILFYIVRQMVDHGRTPYREIFDMNMPGTYLAYLAIDTLAMRTELGLRMVDLALVCILAFLSYRMCPTRSLSGKLYAAFMFPLMYLALGPKAGFQREFLALLPLAFANFLLMPRAPGRLAVRLFLSGVSFGIVATIKPHLLIGLPFALLYLLSRPVLSSNHISSRRQFTGRQLPLLLAGFALPCAITLVFLLAVNALAPLYTLWREYLPLYGKITYFLEILPESRYLKYHLTYLFLNINYVPAVAMGAIAAILFARHSDTSAPERLSTLLIGSQCLAYWAYPTLSGQYWFYHWLPLAYWLSLLLAPLAALRPARFPPSFRLLGALFLIFWTFMATRPDLGLAATTDQEQQSRVALARDLAAQLEERLEPGDSVQPLDWVHSGVIHGVLLADARLATSFVYNFHFYHHTSNPFIRSLRERFISELENERPRFIIEGFPGPPYMTGPDTDKSFEALSRFLILNYRIVYQGPVFSEGGEVSYRIWEREPRKISQR